MMTIAARMTLLKEKAMSKRRCYNYKKLTHPHTKDYVQVYLDNRFKHRWRMKGANHEIICPSSQGYFNEVDMVDNMHKVTGRIWLDENADGA